ncbi:hypothetical protein MC48_018575 [Serratia marcescens]|nr:hypothetical protein MC48_018575 [Serratia marcescens]
MIKTEALIISEKCQDNHKAMIFMIKNRRTQERVLFEHLKSTLKDFKKKTHEFFLRLFLAN